MKDPLKARGCHCHCGAQSVYVMRANAVGLDKDILISAPCRAHVASSIATHVIGTPFSVTVYEAIT